MYYYYYYYKYIIYTKDKYIFLHQSIYKTKAHVQHKPTCERIHTQTHTQTATNSVIARVFWLFLSQNEKTNVHQPDPGEQGCPSVSTLIRVQRKIGRSK